MKELQKTENQLTVYKNSLSATNFKRHIIGQGFEGGQIKLSSITREEGKAVTLRNINSILLNVVPLIKVKNKMSEMEILILTKQLYKEYYWLRVEDLFKFCEWLVTGKGGTIYQTLDIPTFMTLLAKWQSETEIWTKVQDFQFETKTLPPSNPNFVPDFGGLADKLDAARNRKKAQLNLYGPKYLNLEGYCGHHNLDFNLMFEYFKKVYGSEFDKTLSQEKFTDSKEVEKFRNGYVKTKIRQWVREVKEFETSLIKNPFIL